MINGIVHIEMIKILTAIATLVSFCLLIFLLNTTTPVTAGPFGILAIFVFAYLILFVVIAYFLYVISRLIARLSISLISRRPFEPLTLKRSFYYSSIISAAPIMIVGIQSVGSIGVYELLLIAIFVSIGCLYISKKVK